MSKITASAFTHRDHSIPAIYLIINRLNSKVYVGQTVNFYKRKDRHRRSASKGDVAGRPLIAAFRKYGFENFEFSILESPKPCDLTVREQFWMDHFGAHGPNGYNAAPAAGSPAGVKHSEETKKKVGEKSRGRRHTAETLALMSLRHKGRAVSEEAKQKNREAHLGKRVPNKRGRAVDQLCLTTGAVLGSYVSASAAARSIGAVWSQILSVCKGTRKMGAGY